MKTLTIKATIGTETATITARIPFKGFGYKPIFEGSLTVKNTVLKKLNKYGYTTDIVEVLRTVKGLTFSVSESGEYGPTPTE